jgi:hypothetical protein
LSTVNDILKAVREVVVINERIIALSKQVDRLESSQLELRERVIRIETFIDLVRPAITRRALPPPPDE